MKVLFVCLGNICRSPAAEGILKSIVERNNLNEAITIDSAGTYGGHKGERADQRMRIAAENRGYNLTSISRQVKSSDFSNFDLIIAMDDKVFEDLHSLVPSMECYKKIERFANYISKYDYTYVPDPYYQGRDGFELVLDILEDGCENLFLQITK